MFRALTTPIRLIIAAFAFVALSTAAHADKPEIFISDGGLFSSGWTHAVDGYDTVAYHTQGKPVKGSAEFETEYKGAKWLFASQEHLDLFLADPDKYRPQYGGYCAYALGAKRQLVEGDPEVWDVRDGKLYLNINKGAKRLWLKDVETYIAKADGYWPAVLSE